MSELNTNPTLSRKVEELTVGVNAAVEGMRRRNRNSFVVALLTLVLLGVYLFYAYRRFTEVDPEMAGNFTQSVVESYLPEAQSKLEEELVANAPRVVDTLERQVRAMPDTLVTRMEQQFTTELDKHMPELETSIYASVKTGLAQAKDHVSKMPGKTEEEKFRTMLQEVAEMYGRESVAAIDEFHGKYTLGSTDLVNYIKLLSEDQHLSTEQAMHREMLQNFLTLAYYHDSHPGTDHTSMEHIAGKEAIIPGTK